MMNSPAIKCVYFVFFHQSMECQFGCLTRLHFGVQGSKITFFDIKSTDWNEILKARIKRTNQYYFFMSYFNQWCPPPPITDSGLTGTVWTHHWCWSHGAVLGLFNSPPVYHRSKFKVFPFQTTVVTWNFSRHVPDSWFMSSLSPSQKNNESQENFISPLWEK